MIYSLKGAPGDSPLIADSPHSGRDYPVDFNHACARRDLRRAEDGLVDELYAFLPGMGVPLLSARFPRSYIDPNRPDDVSARMAFEPDAVYTPSWEGMVRGKCVPYMGTEIYDRALTVREVFGRVARCWKPYHDRLESLIEETRARHGVAVHLDLHSMPSLLGPRRYRNNHDVIISTREGASAAPGLAARLARLFRARGYKTSVDHAWFKGREILARAGDPARGRHSIQIELNRALYLNEDRVEPKAGFGKLQRDLKGVVAEFKGFCASLSR